MTEAYLPVLQKLAITVAGEQLNMNRAGAKEPHTFTRAEQAGGLQRRERYSLIYFHGIRPRRGGRNHQEPEMGTAAEQPTSGLRISASTRRA
jgi:hypothetical protein